MAVKVRGWIVCRIAENRIYCRAFGVWRNFGLAGKLG